MTVAWIENVTTVGNMGCFDTVHTPEHCDQTKALGRTMSGLRVGDKARSCPTPMTQGQWLAIQLGLWDPDVLDDFQVAMSVGGFLVVRSGVIREWALAPAADLPVVDHFGNPCDITENPFDEFEQARIDESYDDCEWAKARRASRYPSV